MKIKYNKYKFPSITTWEHSNNKNLQLKGFCNKIARDTLGNSVVVSYDGINLKIRVARFSDQKTVSLNSHILCLDKVDDRHNWIGTFELVQDGDWYYLERIEE
jgi:hypothetical protein